MSIYEPFTYHIAWSDQDIHYYGARYKNGCSPEDLWVTYFTSSKHVHAFREEYGEPDIVEVRKTFSTKEEAIEWEQKVLKRLKVKKNDKWLNIAIGKPTAKGYKHTEEHKAYISSILKGRDAYWMKGRKRPDHAAAISNKMWLTNGIVEIYIDKDKDIPEGYRRGRKPKS